MSESRLLVVGLHWHERLSELTFITRSIAGAATRWGSVSVFASGLPGVTQPDGAFDVEGMGTEGNYALPPTLSADYAIVDDLVPEAVEFLSSVDAPSMLTLTGTVPVPGPWESLSVVAPSGQGDSCIGVYVPINPLAEQHRHNGFGFTDYTLVLSGRTNPGTEPPPAVAWLTAAFHDSNVIVVEHGVASAWRGRALRGNVPVDTRMDFWRLLAHARVCVDLLPGRHLARECIESLRFGTPIVVPDGSGAAVAHAEATGGFTFADPDELLRAVATLQGESVRSSASARARLVANTHYGDPEGFATSLKERLSER